jgi:hypothetical protein
MSTRLRSLRPNPTGAAIRRPATTGLFWWAVFAIVLQSILPPNVMSSLGYKVNVHPATLLILICAIYATVRGVVPLQQRLRDAPALMLFVFGIPAVTLYSVYFVGYSGSTVFVESFWSAGLLALLLEPAAARQKRLLGYILIALVVGNVFMALYESITHAELFPISYDPSADLPDAGKVVDDFRAHAFYAHPLTASLVTSMGIFLLYNTRMRFIFAAPILVFMLVGLLAYGGRTALGVTALVSIAAALYLLLAGIAKRKIKVDFALAIVTAVIIGPILLAIIVTQTTIADRIIDNLYYDDSAAVRATQWDIFGHLSLKDWLFGITKEHLNDLKYQIALGGKDTDIENFWILIFLDLGIIGFSVFVALFGGFLVHLARYANTLNGWLLAGSALVIDSSSNSLGVWSNDLFIEVAFLVAVSGFRDYVPARRPRRVRRALPILSEFTSGNRGLMLVPRPFRGPNLRGS